MTLFSVRKALKSTTALTAVSLVLITLSPAARANPLDGQVVAGNATITTPSSGTLVVNQHSQNVVLEWGSFNINSGETTRFEQPNAASWALNRVVGSQDPSVIAGTLSANGNIAIVNPDGIVFSQGSRVDVSGLVATTADIGNDAFMRGNLSFNLPGNPAASVINEGNISIRDHGLAAFVAPGVRNSGVILARFGTVSLASGNTFSLDLYGDGLVSLAIGDEITEEVIDVATGRPMADLVKNEGTISANGGTVALTAATARTAVNSVINNTGVIEANSVGMRNGKIILGAQTATSQPATAPRQTVRVSGQVRATAVTTSLRPAARPGTIKITGEDIQIADATIDASGTNGGGTVLIGGDYLGGRTIIDLFPIGEEIREDYEVVTAATVTVDNATTILASATGNGDGGKIILWSDEATITSADILARGAGDGTGGFIETSSAGTLSLPEGYVTAGAGGMWLLDPEQLYVSNRDAVFGDTEYVDAATVETSLNFGTSVLLVSAGDDARTSINSQISKTAGGDATLSLGSTGSVSINANIISTSGKLTVAVRTADTLEPFVNGSLTGFRDGVLTISDATIETNGGGFGYRGAAFQMTNTIVSLNNGPASDHRPGSIRTNDGAMLFELSALPAGSNDASGTIGCNGSYALHCGQSSQVLDAGSGAITFRQNPNATTASVDNFPRIFVGDYGIATTGTLTLDGVNLRSERRTNRNSVYNVEFGNLVLKNNAIIDFPLVDAWGLEAFYTPVVVSGVTLPTGTYVVGERIIIQLPTLFTSPNSPIFSLDVFGPAGGTYQIIGNELVIDYNGPAGSIDLTFRITNFARVSTDLVLSLNIQEPVMPPPVDNPPFVIGGNALSDTTNGLDRGCDLGSELCATSAIFSGIALGTGNWTVSDVVSAGEMQSVSREFRQALQAAFRGTDGAEFFTTSAFTYVFDQIALYAAADIAKKLPGQVNPVELLRLMSDYLSGTEGQTFLKEQLPYNAKTEFLSGLTYGLGVSLVAGALREVSSNNIRYPALLGLTEGAITSVEVAVLMRPELLGLSSKLAVGGAGAVVTASVWTTSKLIEFDNTVREVVQSGQADLPERILEQTTTSIELWSAALVRAEQSGDTKSALELRDSIVDQIAMQKRVLARQATLGGVFSTAVADAYIKLEPMRQKIDDFSRRVAPMLQTGLPFNL